MVTPAARTAVRCSRTPRRCARGGRAVHGDHAHRRDNSEGCVGRCYAFYDAVERDCDYICDGHDHAAGEEQALDKTRELAEE